MKLEKNKQPDKGSAFDAKPHLPSHRESAHHSMEAGAAHSLLPPTEVASGAASVGPFVGMYDHDMHHPSEMIMRELRSRFDALGRPIPELKAPDREHTPTHSQERLVPDLTCADGDLGLPAPNGLPIGLRRHRLFFNEKGEPVRQVPMDCIRPGEEVDITKKSLY